MSQKLLIYTDGGARGNPGPAAIGVVIIDGASNKQLALLAEYIGPATNNQAEYKALIAALREAKKYRATKLVCFLDSELVVRQLKGQYKIKEPELKDLAMEIFRLSKSFELIEYRHVPREKNKQADFLVNQALDKAGF